MKRIDIYVDGACSDNGNNGIGGWACVVTNGTRIKELSGGELNTTNNRMELLAAIKALEYFKDKFKGKDDVGLRIYSDSAYVVNGLNKRWVKKWITNGWKTSKGTDVQNRDLWEIMNSFDKELDFQMIKVKGHSGDLLNERCDELAKAAVQELREVE